jgi:hypothetical protein
MGDLSAMLATIRDRPTAPGSIHHGLLVAGIGKRQLAGDPSDITGLEILA